MSIYRNYICYVENREERYVELIFNEVTYMITDKIYFIENKKDKEDLIQEILLKVYEVITKRFFKLENLDTFYESIRSFIPITDKRLLDCLNNFQRSSLGFEYERYLKGLSSNFEFEFESYIGSGRLRKYIKRIINSKLKEFNKKCEGTISLNKRNEKGIELLEYITLPIQRKITFDDFPTLSKSERDFLICFVDDGRLLTQKEVSMKIGKTQQAISKRIKQISKKMTLKV